MTEHRRLFQLYLLGQMRNQAAVQRALALLHASQNEVSVARQRIIDAGLEQSGVRLDAYERLLGEPVAHTIATDGDEYQRVRLAFRFEAWPSMKVVVLGSTAGVVGGIRFERATIDSSSVIREIDRLRPWENVRSDLVAGGWGLITHDEWYPVLDVEAQPPSSPARALLQFDFDLLQTVHVLREGKGALHNKGRAASC